MLYEANDDLESVLSVLATMLQDTRERIAEKARTSITHDLATLPPDRWMDAGTYPVCMGLRHILEYHLKRTS